MRDPESRVAASGLKRTFNLTFVNDWAWSAADFSSGRDQFDSTRQDLRHSAAAKIGPISATKFLHSICR